MKVGELISHLQALPQDLPVQVKTYQCGSDFWNTLRVSVITKTVNGEGETIVEIDAE